MRNTVLIVMVGLPGSGKSTWIKNNSLPDDAIISRDEIRFSLVKEGEDYFSREDEVYDEFILRIGAAMERGVEKIFIDQTSVTVGARRKLFRALKEKDDFKNYDVLFIMMPSNLQRAISQNENRKGTRTYVPVEQIRNMAQHLSAPHVEEIGRLHCHANKFALMKYHYDGTYDTVHLN